MFTLSRLAATVDRLRTALPPAREDAPHRFCLALSGGLDSTALLVALSRLMAESNLRVLLRAVHVDHGLHPDSPQWALACRLLAQQHGVPFNEIRVAVPDGRGESPEAAARDARYAALGAQLAPGEVLLTAHHADDQLETILLQWLRGGGLRAVAGMAPMARFGATSWCARPLLEFTRDELAQWAEAERLHWQDDPSNLDLRFDRNYLRLQVLPALRARWPAVTATTARVADFARDALEVEAALVAVDLPRVLAGCALDLEALGGLPGPRQRAVLRAWLAGLALPPASARTLASLRHDMANAAADRVPETRWPGAVVRRYRGHLYAEPVTHCEPRAGTWPVATGESFAWTAQSRLQLQPDIGRGLSRERLPPELQVRQRTGGEQFVPAGGAHHRQLRKWLQERDVLPWRRPHLPLLFAGHHLVAVANLGVAAEFAARSGEPSWRVDWHGRGPVTVADAIASKWPAHPPIR